MEELEHIRQSEDHNYSLARQAVGDSATLVEDLLGLYKLLAEMIENSGVPPHDEIVAGSTFLLGCRYQLTIGSLNILRGHLTDSFFFLRKAIELCAFAVRVKRHPHLAMEWLCAGSDEAAYEQYRKKFASSKIFPDDHALLCQLQERYDDCSRRAHSSVYSLAHHCKPKEGESKFTINFNYFELSNEDRSEPIRTLLYTIDTHLGILRVFEDVLSDAIGHDRVRWDLQRNAVDAKIGVHKGKWKTVIMPS